MKILILLSLISISTIAGVGDSAGGNSKIINELLKYKKNTRYEVEIPTYKFEASHYFRIGTFCKEGDMVRSNDRVKLYETRSIGQNREKRFLTETRFLRRPIYMNDRSNVELNHKIPIYKSNKIIRGRSDNFFPYKKKLYKFKYYDVPSCEIIDREKLP